jgi:glutathione synthase
MNKLKILILTDHSGHSAENSVYALAKTLAARNEIDVVDIASRGNPQNDVFFHQMKSLQLQAHRVDEGFEFSADAKAMIEETQSVLLTDYDWIWLRIPRPIAEGFFDYLREHFADERIINRPSGIEETSSKAFLLQIAEVCPPIKLIQNRDDLEAFRQEFPIVLKPLFNYGGKGVLRIEDHEVWEGQKKQPYQEWLGQQEKLEYLGMQFLKNVGKGDKRIVVCDGQVLTAVLRYPAKGSWMCNIAQGGHAEKSQVDEAEQKIIEYIHPILSQKGIVMYGMDTLIGNDGKRVLSEVNTLSIGGVAPSGQAVVERAIDGILSYIQRNH